jgi:CheY-like chemotaxis protein
MRFVVSSTNPPLRGLTLLVVDDFNTGILRPAQRLDTFGTLLRRAGAMIDVRASVPQARQRLLALAEHHALPHAIITDYQLVGRETGLDLAVWCQQQAALAAIPRLLLSAALAAAEEAAAAQRITLHTVFARCAPKPVDMMALVQDLTRLCAPPALQRAADGADSERTQ